MKKTVAELLADIAKGTQGLGDAVRRQGVQQTNMLKRIDLLETQVRSRGVSLAGLEDHKDKDAFMWVNAIKFILRSGKGDAFADRGCELEAAILREATEKATHLPSEGYVGKDMESGTDSLGGFLVPNQIVQTLIELIRAKAILLQAGVTEMPGLVGSPVEIPREGSDVTAYWVGEVEAPTATDMTVEMLAMTPHTGAAMTKLSQRLLRQAAQAAEAIVKKSMTSKLALLIDLAGLRGDGTNGSPLGIANAASILTYAIGTNGGTITYDHLLAMVATVRNNDALDDAEKPGWLMAPEVFHMIQKMKDSNGRPLITEANSAASEDPTRPMLLGYPVYWSSQVPTNLTKGSGTALSEITFGDIATVVYGSWAGLEIRASDVTEDAFKKRQVHVLAFQEVDIAVQQPGRLVLCNDVKST